MQKPELLAEARAEFEGRIQDTPYVSPIPDGVKPPLEEQPARNCQTLR
jgi:hypothetical protein